MSEEYLFIGGMIDGEKRCDVKGNIYVVPYYDAVGFLRFQTYNKEDLESITYGLNKLIGSAKRNYKKATRPGELEKTEKNLSLYKKQLNCLKSATKGYNGRHVFLFYKDGREV